jgi:myosin heavy subunit
MIGRRNFEDQSADADLEALQTDVMRFMAIIAFSLLVIFIPLVRAIPERDTTINLEVLKKNQKLVQEVIKLKKMTQNQESKILALMKNNLELKKNKNVEVAASLGRLQEETKKREKKIQQLQRSLKEEKIQNQEAHKKLSKFKKSYYGVQLKLVQLQKSHKMVLKQQPEIPSSPSVAKTEKVSKAKAEKKQKPSLAKRPPSKTPREGKSRVIFSSEEGLLRLIENGDVKFFVLTSGKLFESYIKESRIFYRNLSKPPLTQYEMSCTLVPASIQKSIKRELSNVLGPSRRCLLTLSEGINKNLKAAVSRYKSGQFKISRDGTVLHESN